MKKIICLLCFLMISRARRARIFGRKARRRGECLIPKPQNLPKSTNSDLPLKKTSPQLTYDPWPKYPPQIGTLILKQEYWDYMKEAAAKYKISPYLIQAVCAIESRYNPYASSGGGKCYGLMQLHRDTARKYGVDARNPRENIMGGAAVLANLLARCNGDLSRALHIYNATCTAAYEREVKKAFYAATLNGEMMAKAGRKPHQG